MSYPSDFYTEMDNMSLVPSAKKPRIMAVGGGKGGVGKTIVSTMLGICMASMGKKIIILDADFTGANLHGYLNNWNDDLSLNNFFQRKTYDLNDLVQDTMFENLYMIRGVSSPVYTRYKYWEKKKFLRAIRNLEADYVLLDLGAGTNYTTVDFFLSADDCIAVSSPDPLAIQDTFGFVRVSVLRRLERAFHEYPEFVNPLIECADLSNGRSVRSLQSGLDALQDVPESWVLLAKNLVRAFTPKIIFNLVRETEPCHELQALRLAVNELLNVGLDYWGLIHFDPAIRNAVKNLQPEMLLSANSLSSEDVVRIVNRNIIARELNAHKPGGTGWPIEDDNSKAFQNFRICSYRCIAWNCCSNRNGGMPCAIMNQVPLSKVVSIS